MGGGPVSPTPLERQFVEALNLSLSPAPHLSLFTEVFQVPVIGLSLPIMWFYLIMNIITQYLF